MQRVTVIPSWLSNLALTSLVLVLAGTATLLTILLLGAADAKPLGALLTSDELEDAENWAMQPAAGYLRVEHGDFIIRVSEPQSRVYATAPYQVEAPATFEITARQIGGPGTAGYGLWWGVGPQKSHIAFLVTSHGYLAVFRSSEQAEQALFPWQLFPWVQPDGEKNRLRVDIREQEAVLRINDEIVGVFDWSSDQPFQVGLIVQTYEEGGAEIEFEQMRLWKDN